jgi:hypothetical protein
MEECKDDLRSHITTTIYNYGDNQICEAREFRQPFTLIVALEYSVRFGGLMECPALADCFSDLPGHKYKGIKQRILGMFEPPIKYYKEYYDWIVRNHGLVGVPIIENPPPYLFWMHEAGFACNDLNQIIELGMSRMRGVRMAYKMAIEPVSMRLLPGNSD